MLCEHVEMLDFGSLVAKCVFEVRKILVSCKLNSKYFMWIKKIVWNWCHRFLIISQLLYDGTLST